MNHGKAALRLDAEDNPILAAEEYEYAIVGKEATIEMFLNLAVIYFFSSWDFGFTSYYHLPHEFMKKAHERWRKVLDLAEERFGHHSEIRFWRHYFLYISKGQENFDSACEAFANPTESLVPFFYLFSQSKGRKHRDEAEALYQIVRDRTTARKRYVEEILRSRLKPGYGWPR